MNKISKLKITSMIKDHELYITSKARAGTRFKVINSDMHGFKFRGRTLGNATIMYSDLSNTTLANADMTGIDIVHTDMSFADMCMSNLQYASLYLDNLYHATIVDSNLQHANLSKSNLMGADLSGSDLSFSNLSDVNLSFADLTNTILRGARLESTDLTDAKGLISQDDYLHINFEKTDAGYIVYKIFGLTYKPDIRWVIKPGSIITEPGCCMDRRVECGPGINVATFGWITSHNPHKMPIWRCLIRNEWLDGVCIPYATDGRLRCKKLELLNMI